MLPSTPASGNPVLVRRHPDRFLAAPWHPDHPDFVALHRSLPADDVVRWLWAACQRLDLTPLRASYAGRGSRAYPPERMVPFVLLMLFQGHLCPAQWAKQAARSDDAKWLLAGLQPKRSQLYVLADRLAPFLDGWFQASILWAIYEGITQATRAAIDGTFLAALASRHRLVTAATLERRRGWLQLRCRLDHLLADPTQRPRLLALLRQLLVSFCPVWLTLGLLLLALIQLRPGWMAGTPRGRLLLLTQYDQAGERLATQQQLHQQQQTRLPKARRHPAEQLKVCVTDPDAALGRDKEKVFRPLYNLQLALATDAPLVLGFELLSSCTDQGQLVSMIERTEQLTGQHLDEVLVDDAYTTIIDLRKCEERKTMVYGPPPAEEPEPAESSSPAAAPTASVSTGAAGQEASPPKPPQIPKSAFRWEPSEQRYYCPEGHPLDASSRTTEKRQGGVELPMVQYRCAAEHCQPCPRASACTQNPQRGRTVKRYEGEEAVERLQERMTQPEAKKIYRQRSCTVERGNADLKEHRKMRKIPCFGQQRSRTRVGLTLLATNLVAIMRILHTRQKNASATAPTDVQLTT